MAVYLFTYHAYRSWNADKPQGYVRRGEGVLAMDANRAEQYDRHAKHLPVEFDTVMQRVLIDATREVCCENGWRLHQVCVTGSHLHVLVSWEGFQAWAGISHTLKRMLGAALSKSLDRPGPWFSRGGSRKRVEDRQHFEYLMRRYLPRHRGVSWCEGGV